MTRRIPFVAAVVGALLLSLIPAASAAPKPSTYTLVTKTFDVHPGQNDGDYVGCPTGQKVATGGAFWNIKGQGVRPLGLSDLRTSSPTLDRNGWYADGHNDNASGATLQITILAQCVAAAQVTGTKVVTRTRTIAPHSAGGGTATCGSGYLAYAGGSYWHAPNAGANLFDNIPARIGDSTINADGRTWYATQVNTSDVTAQQTIVELCLPTGQLDNAKLVRKTFPLNNLGSKNGGYTICPNGYGISTGGGYFHLPGQGPHVAEALHHGMPSSDATFDHKAWYADGAEFNNSNFVFTVVARCIPA